MKDFLRLPAERRRIAFQQVDAAIGLQAFSVEKDFWVCWILRELYALPGIGQYLTFKGGTSLSKAWKLIERFSEDIDLVVDREVLGFGGDAAPDKTSGRKRRKERLEALVTACRDWVQYRLKAYSNLCAFPRPPASAVISKLPPAIRPSAARSPAPSATNPISGGPSRKPR